MFDAICSNAEKCDVQKFEWGEVVWLHEPSGLLNERLCAGLVKFFPGKSQRHHIHFGEEQILYVIEGSGTHILNGKKDDILKGMLVHCPPYAEHEVVNSGKTDLVFLIIYTPSKVVDVHQNISMTKGKHILELVDTSVLLNIQREITKMLGISVVITDNNFKDITEDKLVDKFCSICSEKNICTGNLDDKYKSTLNKLDKIYICSCKLMKIVVPIIIGEETLGFINCGYFTINELEDYEKILQSKIFKDSALIADDAKLVEIKDSLYKISSFPKSRLYALQESLEDVSKTISGIIENNEMMKNKKEKLDLENALKSNYIYLGSFLNKEDVEYPIIQEERIFASIKKMDSTSTKREIKKLMDICRDREIPIYVTKDTLGELLTALSRIVYIETEDKDTFLSIRYKYRGKLENCNDFEGFENVYLQFAEDVINILKDVLLKGKDNLIQEINEYIKNNYNQHITLNFLSNIFYVSPNYLSTMFNEKNGMSLKDYINRLRIEHAKQYLLETDLKITEISRRIGYSQISYFGSVFKKLECCTPNEWRGAIKR
ncbi:MAG: helix-turn-helix domain-containing protein [Solirubrobacterales bacterium]